eukprot:2923545-Pyramimonas_sp.AAC.1
MRCPCRSPVVLRPNADSDAAGEMTQGATDPRSDGRLYMHKNTYGGCCFSYEFQFHLNRGRTVPCAECGLNKCVHHSGAHNTPDARQYCLMLALNTLCRRVCDFRSAAQALHGGRLRGRSGDIQGAACGALLPG